MPKSSITLTQQDRQELAPLLNISSAERELMPKEVLEKLEILAKEQEDGGFQEMEQIITESLQSIQTLDKTCHVPCGIHSRRHLKEYIWWHTHYQIFLQKRKAQRARHKKHKHK